MNQLSDGVPRFARFGFPIIPTRCYSVRLFNLPVDLRTYLFFNGCNFLLICQHNSTFPFLSWFYIFCLQRKGETRRGVQQRNTLQHFHHQQKSIISSRSDFDHMCTASFGRVAKTMGRFHLGLHLHSINIYLELLLRSYTTSIRFFTD